MSPTIAVCITTHNRCADLARTLAAIHALQPAPDETLVAVDGCTDGTLAMLREKYPAVKTLLHEQARGSIPSRNELATICHSDIFLSLDDDSYPLENDFVARLRVLFADRPHLAVVTFPQRSDEFPESLTAKTLGRSEFVGSYVNSGAAIRRSVFENLGGYPDFFFHAYEEPDFALRCLNAGWQVWCESSLTIRHHFTGAQRNEIRTHHRHARNELWSVLLRCPAPQLAAVALFRIVRQFGYAWKRGLDWTVREPAWWLAALAGVPRCLRERQPLPWDQYRAWMEIIRTPLKTEAEWLAKFHTPAA
jgi:GT2 family glycosyltransferase